MTTAQTNGTGAGVMSPEEIADRMVGLLDDGRMYVRDGYLVRHGYAVDEPLHVNIAPAASSYVVRKMRERIANLVRAVRAEATLAHAATIGISAVTAAMSKPTVSRIAALIADSLCPECAEPLGEWEPQTNALGVQIPGRRVRSCTRNGCNFVDYDDTRPEQERRESWVGNEISSRAAGEVGRG